MAHSRRNLPHPESLAVGYAQHRAAIRTKIDIALAQEGEQFLKPYQPQLSLAVRANRRNVIFFFCCNHCYFLSAQLIHVYVSSQRSWVVCIPKARPVNGQLQMIALDPALPVESEYHLMVAGQFHGNQNLFIVLLQRGRAYFGRIDQLLGLISSDCHDIGFHFFIKDE